MVWARKLVGVAKKQLHTRVIGVFQGHRIDARDDTTGSQANK